MRAESRQEAREERSRGGLLPSASASVVAAGWAVLWFVGTRRLWNQGGYIHLAFAQSLARGEGFGVQGRPVFGDASPLWIGLLAACHRCLAVFTTDWLVAGKALTVVAAIFFAAGLSRFAGRLLASADGATRRAVPALVVAVVVFSPYWGPEAFSGTEVLAAAGVACWACAFVAGSFTAAIRPRRLLAGCACAGCGPLLRPEMLFFSVCLAPFLFVRWVNTPLRFRIRILVFFSGLLLAVGPGACWLLYTVRRFGTALPNTLEAGTAAPEVSVLWQGVVRFTEGAPWLPMGLAAAAVWLGSQYAGRRGGSRTVSTVHWAKLDPSAWLPFAWAAATTVFYLGTHSAVTSREVLLLAPACTASAFAIVSLCAPRFLRWAGLLCAVYGAAVSLLWAWPAIAVEQAREGVYADLAQVVRGLPANERVALAPAGEVLFLSSHPVVDLGGLLDPSAVAFRADTPDARRVWWAQGQGARAMVLDHSPEPGSAAVWAGELPAEPWGTGNAATVPGEVRPFDRIVLWRLPPSPTLPAPTALPGPPQ